MNIITGSSTYASADLRSVIFNDIHIIDLTTIILRSVEPVKIQNLQNIDTQRLFLHHLILNLCECLKQINTSRYIFYLNRLLPQINDIDRNICLNSLVKTLKKMQISYIDHTQELTSFNKKLIEKSDSELILFETTTTKSKNNKSFSKFKLFLKQNGLTFLHDTYFNNPSNKLILFR